MATAALSSPLWLSEYVMKGPTRLLYHLCLSGPGVWPSGAQRQGDHDYFHFIFMLNKGFLGVSAVKNQLAVQET